MAERLSSTQGDRPRLPRLGSHPLRYGLALAVPVLLLHLWLGDVVVELRQGWGRATAPMPERLQVAYVREMTQQTPVVAQRPAPGSEVKPTSRPKALPPADAAASAAKPEVSPPDAASAVARTASDAAVPDEALAAAPPASAPVAAVDAAPSVAGAASGLLTGEPGPEWPLSTRLNYKLRGNYRGEVSGQAQVEWIRQGRRYQVHLDVTIGPSFAPLIARRMSSDGELGPEGIRPLRYDEDTRILVGARRRVTMLFGPEDIEFPDGRRVPVPDGVQDTASQFVHLTWIFLTGRAPLVSGQIVEMPLALPRRLYRWRYEVMGEESLDTRMGTLATWHLRPQADAGGGDLKAEVWVAPSLQFLPVRLRIVQDANTYIDLMLSEAPQQGEAAR